MSQADTEDATTRVEERYFEETADPKILASALVWMVLGDGNITISRGNNCQGFIQITHTPKHLDYIRAKGRVITRITSCKFKEYYHSRQDTTFLQLWTKRHPFFTKMRNHCYLNKRKVISKHSLVLVNPLSLAILYQDDGRRNAGKSTCSINKPLFSVIELEALAKRIVDNFGIIFRVRKSCKLKDGSQGHELALRWSDHDKFFNLIDPYILPSMYYKTPRGDSL